MTFLIPPASGWNDVFPFIDFSEEDLAEVNRPDAIVDFLETDGVLFERIGNE